MRDTRARTVPFNGFTLSFPLPNTINQKTIGPDACVHSSRTGTCSVDDVALALLDHRIVSSLCAPQVLKWPHHHEQWTKNVLVFSNSERTCTLIRLLVVFVATMGCTV